MFLQTSLVLYILPTTSKCSEIFFAVYLGLHTLIRLLQES